MRKKLIIYGASHFNVLKVIDAINRHRPTWKLIGFLDDTKELQGKIFYNYPVLGGRELLAQLSQKSNQYFFNNVISHWSRTQLVAELLNSYGCKVPNLIHPAIDMNYVTIGHGCLLPEGCVVGANTNIGNYVNLRLQTVVSHDVTLEDFVFIGPGVTIGSEVKLKKGCYIGAGATVMLKRTVGEYSIVGAGSLVTKDVMPHKTVIGMPAKEYLKEER